MVAGMLLPPRLEGQYGIKLGLSLATQGSAGRAESTRSGFAAGISVPLRPSRVFQVQPEALYVEKGWEGGSEPKLQYIEVPLFLRLNAPTTSFVPYVLGGPSISFRIGCNQLIGDCPPDSRKVDYGMGAGGGIRLGGPFGITAEGRYTWGLRDVDQDQAGLTNQTRALVLMVGVEF
jgi:hypothetical protein